jgi:hypothetical protein
MIERTHDEITGKSDLEHLYTFKNFPVYAGCSDMSAEEDLKTDMVWDIGKSSGIIQLKKLLPIDFLYKNGHGAGSVGGIWKTHHQEFAQFIMQYISLSTPP